MEILKCFFSTPSLTVPRPVQPGVGMWPLVCTDELLDFGVDSFADVITPGITMRAGKRTGSILPAPVQCSMAQ